MDTTIRVNPLPNDCLNHDHEYHQLVVALSGKAEFEIEGNSGLVTPWQGCLVPSEHRHFYQGIGDNQHLIIDLPYRHPLLQSSLIDLSRLFDSPGYFNIDSNLKLFLSFMLKEVEVFGDDPGTSDFLAFAFLHRLHQRIFHREPPVKQIDRVTLKLDLIDRFIARHLAEKISVSQLADVACMSESHFHIMFRNVVGITPHQYLIQARLKEAARLLRQSQSPVNAIAEQVGFANQSALSNAFKRYYQQTPGQYRRHRV